MTDVIDDDEFLEILRSLAHTMRIIATLGHVQIFTGGDDPPPHPYSKERIAAIKRVWPRLSILDQDTLRSRKDFPAP